MNRNSASQARKNWALLAVLVAIVAILFIITILRFGGATHG